MLITFPTQTQPKPKAQYATLNTQHIVLPPLRGIHHRAGEGSTERFLVLFLLRGNDPRAIRHRRSIDDTIKGLILTALGRTGLGIRILQRVLRRGLLRTRDLPWLRLIRSIWVLKHLGIQDLRPNSSHLRLILRVIRNSKRIFILLLLFFLRFPTLLLIAILLGIRLSPPIRIPHGPDIVCAARSPTILILALDLG
ncbi:hypothetical protein BO70DRAFT_92935 [Aspergillus heteromorphus CBS 117.55]|uniref:Uncharacterized protein n=1 Tax=Aspergillus heteromorphus CBS 117.55 TaxID=1448321 RepID=A0A317VTI2_9EURO|nr:uncharacterized protein BO70DRAFT_92935 [Aspergillus heteromorphus CBS 117.55]PWY76252.1 hypothetical protein BO70DRAFT_92935 [Aspergillus heteromorphus CBS 117.55]